MAIARWGRVVLCAGVLLGFSTTAVAESDWDYWKKRKHWVSLSLGAGPTTLTAADQPREVEGASFQLTAGDSGLGAAAMLGFWITDKIGLEVGYWDFGAVHVPFAFGDPQDNSAGTGESRLHFTGPSGSLLLGYDIGSVQVFGRLGAVSWSQDMSARFDTAGEPAVRRAASYSGTGLTYGAGLGWRFHRGWSLQAQYERAFFGDDKIDLFLLCFSYDFLDAVMR